MQVSPYLNFNGQCEAAFKPYAQCLGGHLEAVFRCAGPPTQSLELGTFSISLAVKDLEASRSFDQK